MNKITYEEDMLRNEFEVYDEITGRKMINKLNKTKLSKYELDEIFNCGDV